MALNRKLSDKPLASTYTTEARVHIYEPNDFSQSPTGSDYQLPIENIEFAATDENAVHKTGNETVAGIKTWQDMGVFEWDIKLQSGVDFSRLRYSLGTGLEFYENINLVFGIGGDGEFYYNYNDYAGRFNFTKLSDSRIYTMPDETGTLATREWVDIQISGIGGTFTDVPSAKLALNSTTEGFLPPRMTTTQKNAISSPAQGLMVFDTTLAKLCVYSGTAWETITSV